MSSKRLTRKHVIIKMPKVKDKENLKSHKRKAVTYKRAPISFSADFLTESFQSRRDWHEILKVMKCKDL